MILNEYGRNIVERARLLDHYDYARPKSRRRKIWYNYAALLDGQEYIDALEKLFMAGNFEFYWLVIDK